MANVHLPVLGPGSLGRDGKRKRPYPADVQGRFVGARKIAYYGLIALWAALPWIPIGGHPAIFLSVEKRQVFLFGATFNAQDLWLVFFLLSGFGFGLLYVTTLLGRVWCGWACPQTVFIEALYRPIERLVNGPRNIALKRQQGPMTWERVLRLVATHSGYLLASLFVAHVFLAYFVSLPGLWSMMRTKPTAHPEAFGWMLAMVTLSYGSFGLFREQFCVVMCPYGRLQSVLIDDDALVVGYDEKRGEPRGKTSVEDAGDCVDCQRCVVVCPTGIDIRQGLQLDCIACTACIDACDEVMDKLERPRGLIRYDSLRGLRGEKRRIVRPRVLIYTAFLLVGLLVAIFGLRRREPFEANLLRLPGTPYTYDAGMVRNAYEIHLVNKSSAPAKFTLTAQKDGTVEVIVPMAEVELEPLGSRRIPVFATMPESDFESGHFITIHVETAHRSRDVRATFLGARRVGTR
jgi:cytochrome c oxidase accessory protein FixG